MVLRRPTYASVTATLALFISLGGGAYAAATLPANSVGSKQIKKNAVDGSKVRGNSLTGADIKESTLAKVRAEGLDKITYKTATGSAPVATDSTVVTARCDAGQRVVGGGVRADNPAVAFMDDSYPEAGGAGWTVHVGTGSGGGTNFTVYAICVPAAAAG